MITPLKIKQNNWMSLVLYRVKLSEHLFLHAIMPPGYAHPLLLRVLDTPLHIDQQRMSSIISV
jgi:hypothetical protein